ncbi:carbohydrate ABC transporter permease [Actinomadura montaniterrae]|uniref:carbohydrate ABC transporter permease n=1 Tax=Actinomadura montaniterrae TaxID=1803903 RepID=UPI001CEF83EB|nr:carbohydrate ABC transporter permease [Actinomadura montaniterrae]
MTTLLAGPGDARHARERRSGRLHGLWNASPLTYLTLIVALALSVFPIYWMIAVATRTNDVVSDVPPPLLPGGHGGTNVHRLFDNPDAYFAKGLLNSAIVSACVTVSTVFFASLAGFAFAKLRFRGKNALLVTIVGTMMIPVQMGIIPLYMIMVKLGWQNHLQAVIVPFLVTGFGVFMMRQYADQAVPDELIEAARVDGCTTFGIYWRVVLPALRPAAGVLGLFTFMQSWNDFMWPLATLSPENPTVQLSINNLANAHFSDYTLMFAGTTVAVLPLLVVFVLFGRQIIGGIMEGAVKA